MRAHRLAEQAVDLNLKLMRWRILPELDLGAPWAVRRRRDEAVEQLGKFLRWQQAIGRELVGTELSVSVPISDRAVLSGRVDRLERDEQGRAVVVDLARALAKRDRHF